VFAKVVVTVMHAKAAFDDEEEFVFMIVVVEDELALDLVELDMLAVEFGGDVGLPVFGYLGELFGEVDFGHISPIAGAEERSQKFETGEENGART
jgi:hypothetical protein